MNAALAQTATTGDVLTAMLVDRIPTAANEGLAGIEVIYLDVEEVELAAEPTWGPM